MQISERTADQVHTAIVERIAAGELRPGDALGELGLAAEFGVSRTPVREALHRLEAAGLAERGARRAFMVRKMDLATLQELFEAVGEMEAVLAGLAARRMTEVERQSLSALVALGEGSDADYGALNQRFHMALHAGAHNRALAAAAQDLDMRTAPWRGAQFRARVNRIESSRAEHRAILEAVLAQDAEAARERMRAHVAASFLNIAGMIQAD